MLLSSGSGRKWTTPSLMYVLQSSDEVASAAACSRVELPLAAVVLMPVSLHSDGVSCAVASSV